MESYAIYIVLRSLNFGQSSQPENHNMDIANYIIASCIFGQWMLKILFYLGEKPTNKIEFIYNSWIVLVYRMLV